MLGHSLDLAAETPKRPIARALGVGHRLQRCKGFRGDDEKGLRWVEIMDGFREISAIYVRDETESQGALAVMLKGLVGHHRSEVGAPDADVDDIANALTGMALPFAAPDPIGEVGHLIEHSVDLGYHVLA